MNRFNQRGFTDGKEVHEKMLAGSSHWGNANKSYDERSSHTYQGG